MSKEEGCVHAARTGGSRRLAAVVAGRQRRCGPIFSSKAGDLLTAPARAASAGGRVGSSRGMQGAAGWAGRWKADNGGTGTGGVGDAAGAAGMDGYRLRWRRRWATWNGGRKTTARRGDDVGRASLEIRTSQ